MNEISLPTSSFKHEQHASVTARVRRVLVLFPSRVCNFAGDWSEEKVSEQKSEKLSRAVRKQINPLAGGRRGKRRERGGKKNTRRGENATLVFREAARD